MKNTKKNTSNNRRSVFTLIELLVVISIIAILIALLMPALSYAKKTAKQLKCQSNMKQATLAFTAYATNYYGRFPVKVARAPDNSSHNAYWPELLARTMGFSSWNDKQYMKFFVCPDDSQAIQTLKDDPEGTRSYAPCRGGSTYLTADKEDGIYGNCSAEEINGVVYDTPRTKLQNIMSPKNTFFLLEFHKPSVKFRGSTTSNIRLLGDGDAKSVENYGGGVMHNKGQNYSFCDGHVKWMKWQPDLNLAKFNKNL